MNIASLLVKSAIEHGDRPALTVHEQVYATYHELGHSVAAMACSLRYRLGLKPGERIAIAMSNCPQFYEVLFAAWHAGLVAVPINAKLHADECAYILANAQARICFASPDLMAALAPLPYRIDTLELVIEAGSPEYRALSYQAGLESGEIGLAHVAPLDPAWLFYTSGTTGRPKGAVLTHRNLMAMTLAYFADIGQVAPGDALLHAAPMSHGSGLYGLPFVAMGGNNVVPADPHFDPQQIWRLLALHPQASLFAAPTMVRRLAQSAAQTGPDTTHLKTIIYGGAPMYRADLELAIDQFGARLAQIYGQGESPMTICALNQRHHAARHYPRHAELLASVGYPRTGVEVRVADEFGAPLPDGAAGEVCVRGDVVMAGYWNDAAASAQALRDGWLRTGDIGRMDPAGFLTLMDRSKDVIISGGSNVYPREVEEVLLRHPAVMQAAVIGAADPEWGEDVVALVVAEPGQAVGAEALDALCLAHIARFKRPKRYHFVGALPTSHYGKVLKTELRSLLARLEAGRAVK